MKHQKYFHIARVNLKSAMIYWQDFIGKTLFFLIIMSIMSMLWKTIYATESNIEGYSFNQMIWYLIVTETIALSGQNIYRTISMDVKTGEIAYLLNKPFDYIGYQFACFIGGTLFGLTLNSIVGVAIGFITVGPLVHFNFVGLIFGIVSVLCGIILDFFINVSLAMSAFWVEENEPFRWIYQKLVFTLGGMLLPLEIFPTFLEQIAKKLPFAYISYIPAKNIVDFKWSFFWEQGMYQWGYLLLAILMSYLLFKRGVKQLNVNGG